MELLDCFLDWFLKYQPIWGNILVVIGWGIVFWYTNKHVEAAHNYNIEAQNRLFKQEVEYKAYCKVQDALDLYSSAMIGFNSYLSNLQIHLSMLKKAMVLKKDWANIPYELRDESSKLSDKFIEFLRTYESNEIIILDFKPLKDELAKENNLLTEAFSNLYKIYLEKIDSFIGSAPFTDNIDDVINLIRVISEKTIDIVGYVYDLRIEMQNRVLGPILGKTIPKRQPIDKAIKVLSLG